MKSTAVILSIGVLCLGAANAQTSIQANTQGASGLPAGADGPQTVSLGAAGQSLDRLATLLDLDAGQKAQVKAILDEEHAKLQEYVQEAQSSGQTPTPAQVQAEVAQLRSQAHDQLSAVLTDTQLQKFTELERLVTSNGPATGLALHTQSANAVCDSQGRCKAR